MITKRRFLGSAFGASSGLLFPSIGFSASAAVKESRVISPGRDYYCGWPTLTRRSNGELLLVWSGGRVGHICPFGRVEWMRSTDEGETWSYPRVLLDGPSDDRDAGVLETAQGSILVTTFTSLAYESHLAKQEGESLGRWKAAHERLTEEQRKAELGTWMLRSTDGGITFSERYRVPVNSPHGPIQLKDGRQLYAGKALWESPKRVGVCESRDDGQTWQWIADIPTREGDDQEAYHELHAVEAPSGKIIVQIRNHNPANKGETLQCESEDGGKTWTTPHGIGVWGLPSHLLRLKDGRLLMSYGHRRPPFGNQARLSEDEGVTWSEPLLISGDGAGGDLGYPSTVELGNGELLSAWYEKLADSPKAVLRQARWQLG